MNIDDKIAECKADIEKCERVCAVTAIGSIRDAALRKADDCKEMVEWLEDYKRLKAEQKRKADILDKISTEIEKLNPIDYSSIFAYEKDILDIVDQHRSEGEE